MSTCSINWCLNEAKELLRLIGDRTLNSFACCLYLIDMGNFWEVLNLRYIGIAWFCRVPMYSLLGYIGIGYFCWIPMYPECIVFGIYIGNIRLRAFPMYYCTSFSRRYIGIEIAMPIPMYEGPNLSIIYIGMGQYRLFPMYRQILPIINTSKIQVLIQSRCIHINFPRFYLLSLAVYSRASRLK